MASVNWLNQLLGGIAGAGQGIAQQQAYRQQQAQSDQADELQKAKLADINAQAAERQAKANTDARKRQAITEHLRGALQGDVTHQAALVSEVPEFMQYFQPKPKDVQPSAIPGTPEWRDAEIAKAKIGAQYGYHPPRNIDPLSPEGQAAQIAVAQGKPKAGGGSQAEMNHARLAAASQQIANADDAMTAFEEKVKTGQVALSSTTLELARKAMSSDLGSATAYGILARHNPEVAQYVRSAKEAATAERMITPRGGTTTLMNAEQMLMSAGAGGNPQLIEQARAYRKTLRHALSPDASAASATTSTAPSSADAFGDLVPQQ
jgi:hypothetical protein